jgi:hypothetical protein
MSFIRYPWKTELFIDAKSTLIPIELRFYVNWREAVQYALWITWQ